MENYSIGPEQFPSHNGLEGKDINNQKTQSEINQLRKSLLNYRFQKATGQLGIRRQVGKRPFGQI